MKNNVKSVEAKKYNPIKRKAKAIAAAGALMGATMFGANACKQVVTEYVDVPVPCFKFEDQDKPAQKKVFYIDDSVTGNAKTWIEESYADMDRSIALDIRYNCRAPINIFQRDIGDSNSCKALGFIGVDDVIDDKATFKANFNNAITSYIAQNTL
ncbi:MAG: hypothetical protein LBG10_02680 [Treponema sp.]|jgi:hypothetical protein|nr:hypothetical protein [Treponema sp.]